MSEKKFDVVVFGATSFVGQIICRYLVERYGVDAEVKWAAAGRSLNKLEQLKESLGNEAELLPLLTADASDEASLRSMCEQSQVVLSTVGPYALYGEPLVKVCVETGTDYCDLTGEVQWIHEMLSRYESRARQSGAHIVHCCGFDSIPSDLGVYFLQQQALKRFSMPCQRVKFRVKAAKGGFSGGTVASLLNLMELAASDRQLRKNLKNPYWLCTSTSGATIEQPDVTGAAYDESFHAWIAPFIMAGINTRVVHRSNDLSGFSYGADFQYDEAVLVGDGLKGRLSAYGLTVGMGGFLAAAAFKPTRRLLQKYVLPEPGEGPSPKEQQEGFFDVRIHGRTASGEELLVKVAGDRDPGYGSTAKMITEAALTLRDVATRGDGGFWTPSTLLGSALLERLQQNAGLTFDILG